MEDVLRKLQLTQLEILKVFDRFCREHDLKYSLYAGSLLGAVRHQGFIPWDDDLDVCMPRADYDRFIQCWTEKPVEGYVLQNKENSRYFVQSFTKLRKDHTTFLQNKREGERHGRHSHPLRQLSNKPCSETAARLVFFIDDQSLSQSFASG